MKPRPTRRQAATLRHRQLHGDLNAIIRTAQAAIRAHGEAADEGDPELDEDLIDDEED